LRHENPLPLEEAEILPNVVVKENQAEEKKEGEEIVLESGLVVDETHVTPFVTPIVVSTEVQQPPVHEQEHMQVVNNQKIKNTKKAEQKKIILQMNEAIGLKETELQNAIANEDYDKAHEIQCIIEEQKSQKIELLASLDKH